MIIFPAIDLKDGQCVRLLRGDMNQNKIYNDSPARQAAEWQAIGFPWLHVVDLDGAIQGKPVNEQAVRDILQTVDIPVQLGGGIRSIQQIEHWLGAGVSRVILGTVAVRDPDLVRRACAAYPGRIVIGLDARQGRVAVQGWMDDTDMMAVDLARAFEGAGAAAIIYTDIDRDGTGAGVNIEATRDLARAVKIPVIASGGLGSLKELEILQGASADGVAGVVIGRAFYERTIDPAAALALVTQKGQAA